MDTLHFIKKRIAPVAATILVLFSSCDPQETPLQEEAASVAEDVISDMAFEDADDLAGLALLADPATAGGRTYGEPRVITVIDPRCNCENLVITIELDNDSSAEHPKGTITIDFGAGCTDPIGNVRKGKIIVSFNGRRFQPGSTVITTFQNYSINDIQLEGIRTLTNISESNEEAPAFEIELTNGRSTWPDGTQATREHCYVREWTRAANPLNDALTVSQCGGRENAATGTNRRGRSYAMKIVEPLVYKRGCPIAVSGIKELTDLTSGKVITVDYGNGSCDRTVTMTFGGQSRTIEVNRRG